jgi:hypothetical protein
MRELIAAVFFPQCPECGLPMRVARITPALRAESGQDSDNYLYECQQGHAVTRVIEQTRSSCKGRGLGALLDRPIVVNPT